MADFGLKISIKKVVLQHLLDKAAAVVPSGDLMPVLKNFLIVADVGWINVIATDLELSVVASSELVHALIPGRVVLPAKQLLEIVHVAEDGDVEISIQHDGEALIQSGRASWTLKLPDGSDYPEMPVVVDLTEYAVDRVELISAIHAVRHAASTEAVKRSLMMLNVTDGQMRAADGVRFQQIAVGKDFPDVQIPIKAVDDLLKILTASEADVLTLCEDDNCLIFKISGDVFIVQKLNADFPNVNELLLKPALTNDQRLTVDRLDFIGAIKRVRITADPESSAISLDLNGGSMFVKSKDKYNSACVEEVDVVWEGKPRRVAFNHQHLIQMLQMSTAKRCEFWLGEDVKSRPSPLLLRDDDVQMVGVLSQQRLDWLL